MSITRHDKALRAWHKQHGGHCTRRAGFALRILQEVVELCLACGATPTEMFDRLGWEITRQSKRAIETTDLAVAMELADVIALCVVLDGYLGEQVDLKALVGRLADSGPREADPDGVLWKPGQARPASANLGPAPRYRGEL